MFFLLVFLIPSLFLMWAMVKGLQSSGHLMKEDADRMTRNRRRVYWTWVVFFPTSVAVGGILGAVLKSSRGAVAGSFVGDIVGVGVALIVSVPVAVYLGRTKQPSA